MFNQFNSPTVSKERLNKYFRQKLLMNFIEEFSFYLKMPKFIWIYSFNPVTKELELTSIAMDSLFDEAGYVSKR